MELLIILTSHQATLELREGDRVKASTEFSVDNDLNTNILPHIEVFLKEQGVDPLSLENVSSQANDAGFTTERIGQSVANAFQFALTQKQKKNSKISPVCNV